MSTCVVFTSRRWTSDDGDPASPTQVCGVAVTSRLRFGDPQDVPPLAPELARSRPDHLMSPVFDFERGRLMREHANAVAQADACGAAYEVALSAPWGRHGRRSPTWAFVRRRHRRPSDDLPPPETDAGGNWPRAFGRGGCRRGR
jgi:hypothetical protein